MLEISLLYLKKRNKRMIKGIRNNEYNKQNTAGLQNLRSGG